MDQTTSPRDPAVRGRIRRRAGTEVEGAVGTSGGDRVERSGVSPIPGIERWSYGAFEQDPETKATAVPLIRDDGKEVTFSVPEFVDSPDDLRMIATVVIGAVEKWEAAEGLGA
jgi:hypothetical protein